MTLETELVAKAEMLVRKPVSEVFEAFVDPAITTRFWFTKSSGRLEAGRTVRWDWEMCGVSTPVVVKWPGTGGVATHAPSRQLFREHYQLGLEWDAG